MRRKQQSTGKSAAGIALITGGAGFIGSHLTISLLERGWSVRILDILSPQVHGSVPVGLDWLGRKPVEFLRGSVTRREDLIRSLDGVDHVIHLAAETGTGQSMYEIGRYNEVNSQGTALLLDVLANTPGHRVCRVVLSSSRAVYGEGAYACLACSPDRRTYPTTRSASQLAAHHWDPCCTKCGAKLAAIPTCETDPLSPASIYAATKCAQEDLVRVACGALGIGYAILRLQNVYGERQSLRNPYTGILSIFSTRIRSGFDLPIFEDGLETRDFVHVEDVVNAMICCMTASAAPNQVINVGSGFGTTVEQVAKQLTRSLGAEPNTRVTGEFRLGDIRHNVADIARLREVLGYIPRIDLNSGIQRFADWVLTQSLPDDHLSQANAELRARKLMG